MGQPSVKLAGRRLLTVLALCFCANVLCVLVRIDLSIAAPLISSERGWGPASMGFLLSAFFLGYVAMMVPSGLIVHRVGPRRSLAWGIGLWSLFTVVTMNCARFASFAFWRVMTGAAQGVNFPAINQLIADTVGIEDRAKAQGFVLSGMVLASAVGLPLGTWISGRWGWPAMFLCFGVAGFLWLACWLLLAPHPPEALDENGMKAPPAPVKWRALLTHRASVGLTASYFAHNYGSYFLLTWLPTYLVEVHKMSVISMGWAAALPSLAGVVAMNGSGWATDSLIRKGCSRERTRKVALCGGMALSGLFMLLLAWADSTAAAVTLLTLSVMARSVATPSYWSLSIDLAPSQAGILSAIMNTSGNAAGVIVPALTGVLVARTGEWTLPIVLAGLVTLGGALIAGPTVSGTVEE